MDRVAPFFMTHGVDVFVLKRDVKIQPTAGSFVHVLMLSNQAVCGLPRLRAPGVVHSSWYDHSMLASLL